MAIFAKRHKMAEVFISYSWDSDLHKEQVLSLADHLRKEGFDTTIDRMLSQNQSATNFVRMMHEAMLKHEKVIVVLSTGYKQKAEEFKGGVGEEYQLLINDIQSSPQKYVLVSFTGRGDDVVPYGLKGRDIVDLTQGSEMDRLYRKLMNQPEVVLSPVGPSKPVLPVHTPQPFSIPTPSPAVSVLNFSAREDGASLFGGLYKSSDNDIWFDIKNQSPVPIDDYSYEVRFSKYLDPEYYTKHVEDEEIVYSETIKDKLFPGQTRKSKIFRLKVTEGNIGKVLGTKVSVRVYTASGSFEKSINLTDLIKLQRASYGDPVPLRRDLFH